MNGKVIRWRNLRLSGKFPYDFIILLKSYFINKLSERAIPSALFLPFLFSLKSCSLRLMFFVGDRFLFTENYNLRPSSSLQTLSASVLNTSERKELNLHV